MKITNDDLGISCSLRITAQTACDYSRLVRKNSDKITSLFEEATQNIGARFVYFEYICFLAIEAGIISMAKEKVSELLPNQVEWLGTEFTDRYRQATTTTPG